jgi:hypothetical protein
MWCLIAIAIASSAPPTDCSMVSWTACSAIAGQRNRENWRQDVATIPYVHLCISSQQRAKYLQAQLVEKAINNAIQVD